MIKIQPIQLSNKKDRERFIKLPFELYKNDPHWVAPLLREERKLLNEEKHPFFNYGEMQAFLAYKEEQLVGRIAAMTNTLYDKQHGPGTGFMGFFECINNQEVANELFQAAEEWLRQKGMKRVQGPASPSSNYHYGALAEGFDDSPRIMMAYNPRYHLDLYENYGFEKAMGLLAFSMDDATLEANSRIARGAEAIKQRSGMEIRTINMKKLPEEIEKIKLLWAKGWEENWGYVPLTTEELDALAQNLKTIADPELILFGYIADELVGFALALPDYNYVFKRMKGKMLPFGWLTFLTSRKKIEWIRILMLGILPDFQRKGLDVVFYYELYKRGAARGYKYAEGSWILENNTMMKRGAKLIGAETYKKYNVYEKQL